MSLKVSKVEVWSAAIDDRAGGAADKVEPLAKAGANFEFVFARRTPEKPGMGIVFITPVKGAKVIQAARAAGFDKSLDMHPLRIEGTDKPGVTAKVVRALAGARISFRGFSASAVGKKFVGFLVVDNAEDAARAAGLLKKIG
jgi:hypothetical protein